MKKTSNIIIRVDNELKNQFQKLVEKNDFTMSAVLNACMMQMVLKGSIPLNIISRINALKRTTYENDLTISKIKQFLEEAIKEANLENKINKVYLFGSYSRGEETEDSDVDIRVEYGERFNLFDLSELSFLLRQKTGKKVDIATQGPTEMDPDFYNNIRKDEICIYERA